MLNRLLDHHAGVAQAAQERLMVAWVLAVECSPNLCLGLGHGFRVPHELGTTLHVHGAASPLLAPAPGPAGGGAQEDELLLVVALAAPDGETGLPPKHGPRGAALLAPRLGGRRCGRPPGRPRAKHLCRHRVEVAVVVRGSRNGDGSP
jgi:hypothetical protein